MGQSETNRHDEAGGSAAAAAAEPRALRQWSRVDFDRLGAVLTEQIALRDAEALMPGPGCLDDLAALVSMAPSGFSVSMRSVNRLGLSVCVAWPPLGPLSKPDAERLLCARTHGDGATAIELAAADVRRAVEKIDRLELRGGELDRGRVTRRMEEASRRRLALAAAVLLACSSGTVKGHDVAIAMEIGPGPGWGLPDAERARLNASKPNGWAACWPNGVIVRAGLAVGRAAGGDGEVRGQYEAASVSAAVFAAVRAWVREVRDVAGAEVLCRELSEIVDLIESGGRKAVVA